jgi:Ni/Co efflux regulator RcnB
MKTRQFCIWLLASTTTLTASVASLAQRNDHESGRGNGREPQGRGNGREQQVRGYGQGDGYSRRDAPSGYRYQNRYQREDRGGGPDHDFRVGGRLPQNYRHNTYVVNDWRGHNLYAPPRGYHWVQTGSDYVLVAIATGIILQLLLSNY